MNEWGGGGGGGGGRRGKRPNDWPEPFAPKIMAFRRGNLEGDLQFLDRHWQEIYTKLERVGQNLWTEDNNAFNQILQNAARP